MNWIEKIKRIFPEHREKVWKTKEVFRNLVFKGGGIRGIAYMGALKAMDEHGLLCQIERVAGTSSGAVASLLFSFRIPLSRMNELFNTLDLSKVPQNGKKANGLTKKILPLKSTASYPRLFEVYGWYSSEYFYQ